MTILDTTLDFLGFHGCSSTCRVVVYERADGRGCVIVICELPSNTGTSVTNASESVANTIRARYPDVVSRCTHWLEHYIGEENVDLIVYRQDERRNFCLPTWRSFPLEEFRKLIGEATFDEWKKEVA